MKRFDAVVIGGGPAGAATALGLAGSGFCVALVEKVAFPRLKVCGEFISATTWPILARLGAGGLASRAGPGVRRVGLMAAGTALEAPMPSPRRGEAWGRALRREVLDPALLERAIAAGAFPLQPARATAFERVGDGFRIRVASGPGAEASIEARIVVCAHGSWERAPAPREIAQPARGSDLLGFKARFSGSALAADLMPLILFPGGYGGMVHLDDGTVSFSCCIRRDALRRARTARPALAAGDAVLAHARASCVALDDSLRSAAREGAWLAAGPIRPGVRARFEDGVFAVGNAAGEAHPLIAEGISMAIQSASLLCQRLRDGPSLSDEALRRAGRAYARDWRRQFAPRIHASRLFAALTLPQAACRASVALLSIAPAALTLGARFSGKARIPDPAGESP